MKKFFFAITVVLLFGGCSYIEEKIETVKYEWNYFKEFCSGCVEHILRGFSISNKDNLDRLVGEYYHYFKSADGDSSNFIIDFDKVIPSEWDTLVYVKYNHYDKDSNSDALLDYMDGYLPDDKEHSATELHLLHGGNVVHKVNLYMVSDDAKGVFFCTKKDFIMRSRRDSKFHLEKSGKFFVIRDTAEEFVPMISF